METFQSVKTRELDNMITQSVDLSNDSVIAEQVEKFDNNYSDTKIKELTTEFDSIVVDEEVLNSVTLTEDNVISQEKVSFRTKLFMTCAIAITSLLMFLAIFNIFSINAVSSNIQMLERNIATESIIYNALQSDVDNLNDTTNIMSELGSNGYFEVSDSDLIYVEVSNSAPVVEPTGSTNWFDAVCNFVSSIFGG